MNVYWASTVCQRLLGVGKSTVYKTEILPAFMELIVKQEASINQKTQMNGKIIGPLSPQCYENLKCRIWPMQGDQSLHPSVSGLGAGAGAGSGAFSIMQAHLQSRHVGAGGRLERTFQW